jgi:hypothetical protein
MRTLLVSALALGAFTSAAVAGPVSLTDAQMDSITAGIRITIKDISGDNVAISVAAVEQVNYIGNGTEPVDGVSQINWSTIEINTTAGGGDGNGGDGNGGDGNGGG